MVKRLRSPIRWFGGKGMMKSKIMPFVTVWDHDRYVEPFGGGASILIAKPPVGVETYNDIDSAVVDFFKVIADVDLFERFHRRVGLLPYSRELFNEYRETWHEEEDSVERVSKWFLCARQVFSGKPFSAGWSSGVTRLRRGMTEKPATWISALELLPEIHKRLQRVQIEHADFRDILRRYDTDSTLFYCDPPYVHATRRDGQYNHELADEDHEELVERLLNLEGEAVLSGYDHAVYAPLIDAGWKREDFEVGCHASGRTNASGLQGEGATMKDQRRVECLWLSPGIVDAMRTKQIDLFDERGNDEDSND